MVKKEVQKLKKRYLCLGVSAFALGIAIFGYNTLTFTIIAVLGIIAGILMLIKNKISIIIFALLFIIGGFYGNFADTKTSPLEKYTTVPCSGEMFVTDIEELSDIFVKVKATVTRAGEDKPNEPVLFTIYGISDISPNKLISFENIKFSVPHRARNDGGVDYNRYLKSRGIYFIASADVEQLKASGEGGFVVFRFFRNLKQQFARRCQKIFKDSYAAGIIPAMLTGNDVYIDTFINKVFSEAGITHILVASGLHVSVVVSILALILFSFRYKRKIYEILSGMGIISFSMLVGYSPSIVRAVGAYFIYWCAKKLLRSADPITVLFETMGIILIINPLSIYNLSFQLSFGAVFGILMFTEHIISRLSWFIYPPYIVHRLPKQLGRKIEKGYRFIVNASAVSISAQLGVLPLMMESFGEASVFALFINVVISLVILPVYGFGIIASIFNLEPFVTITKRLCDFIIYLAKLISAIPGNKFQLPQSNILTVSMCAFVIVCLLRCKLPKFRRFFEPMVFLCVAVAIISGSIIAYVPQNKAEVTFLNVGHGDCAIIRLADRKTVMVDTGTELMFNSEVLDFLDRKNIEKIDYLFLSHGDSDHSGGLKSLQQLKMVEKVVTGPIFDEEVDPYIHQKVKKGDKINIGNACFEILYAPENANNSNDSSVVMKMNFGKSSFLFTGDTSKKVEPLIENIDADVLKVSHHGAKNTCEEEFLVRVSPEFSVISVDKNNSYGHPDKDVLESLKKHSKFVFRTDRDKTITITADLNGDLKLTKRLQAGIINDRK